MVELKDLGGRVWETGNSLVVTLPKDVVDGLGIYPGTWLKYRITQVQPVRMGVAQTYSERQYGYLSFASFPYTKCLPPVGSSVDVEIDGRTYRCRHGSPGRVTGSLNALFYNNHPRLKGAIVEVVIPGKKLRLLPNCDCHPHVGEKA